MSKAEKSPQHLKSVDPVWHAIREDAERIMRKEPVLTAFVMANVLNHDSFESALAFRLAEQLQHSDLSADLLRQTFEDMIASGEDIGERARADVAATLERDPACNRAIMPLLYFKGFQAIQTQRFANALWRKGDRDTAYYLQNRASMAFQVDIHPAVSIGKGIMLDHGTGLVVGETATIGDHVSILQGVTLGGTGKVGGDRHPKVGSGVLIGAGAKVLGNITIGECARIAAGSVVLKDVPPHMTVAGVPAKVIGEAGCPQPASIMDQMVLSHDMKS